jgi:hypothetical protein
VEEKDNDVYEKKNINDVFEGKQTSVGRFGLQNKRM